MTVHRDILVCGSRSWNDRFAVKQVLADLRQEGVTQFVIHGAAKGADAIGAEEALRLGFCTEAHPANWDLYGKRAGYLRNIEMLDRKPTLVVAFYDGESKGTAHTIREAEKRGIETRVVTRAIA